MRLRQKEQQTCAPCRHVAEKALLSFHIKIHGNANLRESADNIALYLLV